MSNNNSSDSQISNVALYKRYPDLTIFNNGTSIPTPGLFNVEQKDRDCLDAFLVVDCRSVKNNKKHRAHPFSHQHREEEMIVDVLSRMLEIPLERAYFLLHMGAIQLSVFPTPMAMSCIDNFPKSQRELAISSRNYFETAINTHNVKNQSKRSFDTPTRVRDPNIMVKTGNYLRVRLHPRRSMLAKSMTAEDWRARVLYEDESCMVVDKPAGITTVPTSDNIMENMAVAIGQMKGYEFPSDPIFSVWKHLTQHAHCERIQREILPYRPDDNRMAAMKNSRRVRGRGHIKAAAAKGEEEERPYLLMYTLQRLDVGTCGCVLLGKTKEMTLRWRELIRSRQNIRKFYKALCFSFVNPFETSAVPIPIGPFTHYLELGADCISGPKNVRSRAFDETHPDRKECKLIIQDVQPVVLLPKLSQDLNTSMVDDDSQSEIEPLPVQMWEVSIELETGRTHQIRAQLETFGMCIVGDDTYPQSLWGEKESMLDGRIALQACRLELKGLGAGNTAADASEPKVFLAGKPWWRTENFANVVAVANSQIDMLKQRGLC